jgi:hypothetical protein
MSSSEQEELAPFFNSELREHYIKLVAQACAMFRRIEDFIIDMEDLERVAYEQHHVTKAKEMKSRLNTLRLRLDEAHRKTLEVVDTSILDVDLLLLAISCYRNKIREFGIGDAEEREAAKAQLLHVTAFGKRKRAREREAKREQLKREREKRAGRSFAARQKGEGQED